MGCQLLFCVETDKQCNSDWIYIKNFIDTYCTYDKAEIRFEKLYMGGKGKYNTPKFERMVQKKISDYKKITKGDTVVIYCFDCDDYDIEPRDKDRIEAEEQYCRDKGFEFVWFCKDIERVFVGQKVPDDEKKKTAEEYSKKGLITTLKPEKMHGTKFKNGVSNLANVLERYMTVMN